MMAAVEQSGSRRGGLAGGWRRVEGTLRPRLRDFRTWWARSLAAWLPERVSDLFGLAPQRLLLRRRGDAIELALWRRDRLRPLADLPVPDTGAAGADPWASLLSQRAAATPRWLLLPAQAVLRRRLTLPLAAADRLREVLGFEVDRQTPFTAAEVSYDARVLERRGDGQLDVELVVAPKATLERALEGVGALAPTLAGIDVADAQGAPLGINLMSGAQRRRRDDPWRRRNLALLLVAAAALFVGLWQLLANRRAAADVFQQQVDEAVRQARGASLERRQLVDLIEGGAFLQATRAARPTMVEVMDELAHRLPDNTTLEKLSIEGDRILLIGLSSEASALVGKLQGSPLWSEPALAGALQPDPRTRTDRFTLTARLASGGATPKAPAAAETPDAAGGH